jgi:protoheme IX farnesyltransferase
VSRLDTFPGNSFPGNRPPAPAARVTPPAHAGDDLRVWDGPQVALAAGLAAAAAAAAGLDDPRRLGVLAASSLLAAAGALSLGHRARAAPAVALVAASQVAVPVLGPGPALYLLAGALLYGVLYVRVLAGRTPFAILAAGAAAACLPLAGWEAAASAVRPTPLLLAAVVFLWVPAHAWSLSLATDRGPGTRGMPLLLAAAGRSRTGAAVFAASCGAVGASLVLAPRLPLLFAAVAVPAGAGLLWTAGALRKRADAASARRVFELSGLYLAALLVALVLASP